jgi:hypothetical protein
MVEAPTNSAADQHTSDEFGREAKTASHCRYVNRGHLSFALCPALILISPYFCKLVIKVRQPFRELPLVQHRSPIVFVTRFVRTHAMYPFLFDAMHYSCVGAHSVRAKSQVLLRHYGPRF